MKKSTRKPGTFRTGSFQEFKEFTLAVVRGKHKVDPSEPKIWVESADPSEKRATQVQFQSLEAGAKLLSPKNRALLRLIADRQPKSVSELATLSHRAEQNLLRTLHKLSEAGLVRLDRGAGRAYQPVVTARRVHFEIDLLG
jgi:predicted transcriptional regulator